MKHYTERTERRVTKTTCDLCGEGADDDVRVWAMAKYTREMFAPDLCTTCFHDVVVKALRAAGLPESVDWEAS